MRGFEQKIFGPLLSAGLFLAAAPGRARAIDKFFGSVLHVLHQNEILQGDRTQKLNFH
jgi:hypothetical protein